MGFNVDSKSKIWEMKEFDSKFEKLKDSMSKI